LDALSPGTSHLASKWMNILREQHHGDYEITQRDVECVTIAGLVHDLGAFSAVFLARIYLFAVLLADHMFYVGYCAWGKYVSLPFTGSCIRDVLP
jgi:hypothetical protein